MLKFNDILKKNLSLFGFSGNCDPNDPAVITAIAHLKYDCIESWPDILRYWSVTHPLRIQYLKETRPISQSQKATSSVQASQCDIAVSDYLKNWSVLALPNGYQLVRKLNLHFECDVFSPFLIFSLEIQIR